MGQASQKQLKTIYQRLHKHFGPQYWWPAQASTLETRRFEISVGAILTQNTNWSNAAKAVDSLRRHQLLKPDRLAAVPMRRLASFIRSSGYFNQKAKKLKAFAQYLNKSFGGQMSRMKGREWPRLRKELLAVPGIGPETADSILLYALEKPVFVVDAYTRRILARHSLVPWEASYDQIQGLFQGRLPTSEPLFNSYHALLVAVGKHFCRKQQPLCHACPLKGVGRLHLETPAAPKMG